MADKLEHALEVLKAIHSDNPEVKVAIQVLGDAIAVGNITGLTRVAIGRSIRQTITQRNLPTKAVAALLDVRSAIGGLDPDRYQLGTLLEDHTRNFVGRDYVFAAIDDFLTSQPNGYFIIEGDPGMGKSAILAEYVRRSGCIVHFNVHAQGIVSASQFLENICTQLIVDYGLPYSGLPPHARSDGTFLSHLLDEAMVTLEAGERIVIAVDALDEVDATTQPSGANILYLPVILPYGVYFIMTRRQVALPFVTQAPQTLFNLMSHPEENLRDVQIYLYSKAQDPELRTWIDRQQMTVAAFVETMAYLSENNFMYLRYVLPEIEKDIYATLHLENLPRRLEGYYEDYWQHMRMTAAPLLRVKLRIIYILCEVRQPVSLKLITRFADNEALHVDEVIMREVLDEWDQFLHEQDSPDGTRYSIYNSSFRDFLHREDIILAAGLTVEGINALIAKKLWTDLFGDPLPPPYTLREEQRHYTLSFLAYHLATAQQSAKLYALINRSWMELKLTHTFSYRSFAEDVDLAIVTASAETPINWVEMVRNCFIYATLGSRAANIPPVVLEALARVEQVERAVSYASLINDPMKRGQAYLMISEALIDNGNRKQAKILLIQAEEAAKAVEYEDEEKVQLLTRVASALAQLGEVRDALFLIRLIKYESDRIQALIQIASTLAHSRQKEDALNVVREIKSNFDQAKALVQVTASLALVGQIEVALNLAKEIDLDWYRAEALAQISIVQSKQIEHPLVKDESFVHRVEFAHQIATEALSAAEKTKFNEHNAEVLTQIAIALAKSGNAQLALTVTDNILPLRDKAQAMAEVATALAQLQQGNPATGRGIPIETIEELVQKNEVERAATVIGYIGNEAVVFAQVANILAQNGRHPIAYQLLLTALETARKMGQTEMLKVLGYSAFVLASIDNGQTLWKIYEAVSEVESWWS